MADLTRIQFKRSKTPNVRPAPDTVAEGEIVLNLADRAILTKLGNEIIDLGFAKGGKVDGNIDLNGNIDQKNGHFNTTGNINVGGTTTTKALTVGGLEYSGIDIRQHTNRYIRLENTAHGAADFAILWKRDADDSNLSSFKFPAGHGMGATREWTARMIDTDGNTTFVRNPNGDRRLCLVAKDTGETGAYDYANSRWAFTHNQASMEIYGAITITASTESPDYANIRLKKGDGRYVQIETKPHAGSGDMLAFAYKQADGSNQHVITMPYDSGTLATREWTNQYVTRSEGGGSQLVAPGGQSTIAVNPNGNTGFWDETTKRWIFVSNPSDISRISNTGLLIRNEIPTGNQNQTKLELVSPDQKKAIGLYTYNDGRNLLSAKNDDGSWTNIRISNNGFDVPVSLRLTGGDYAGLQMMRSDGTYTRIEQNPMSSSYLLSFIGRDASGTNQHVLTMPRETGTIATREWTQNNAAGMATINVVYPVGVVMWFAQNKNPNSLFPGTKWVYVGENKTIRLANSNGSNVMSSGGNDNVALSAGHMPSHTHSFSGTTSWFDYGSKGTSGGGAHDHGVPYSVSHNNNLRIVNIDQSSFKGESKPLSLNGLRNVEYKLRTDSNGNHSHSVAIGGHNHTISGTTGASGSGSAFSVVNSYVMLMAWYRES